MIYHFVLLKTIIGKDFLYLKRYWLNSIFSIIMMSLFFLILAYGANHLEFEGGNVSNLLGGYIIWIFMRDCNLNSVQKTIYFVLWIETVKSTS